MAKRGRGRPRIPGRETVTISIPRAISREVRKLAHKSDESINATYARVLLVGLGHHPGPVRDGVEAMRASAAEE